MPVGVDPDGTEACAVEGPGVRRRPFGGPGQVAGRTSAQRVSRLGPAAACAAGHDPPGQLGGPGVQAARRYRPIIDPEGNAWMIATHVAEPTPQEMRKKMAELMKAQAATSGSKA